MAIDQLLSPVAIGAIECKNRVFMAPLTRCRATPAGDAPHALNAIYYEQRAGAGLIISEATQISQQGKGYAGAPGIYSGAQVAGWRLVTDSVHQAGGRIIAQLWHVGRISHPSMQPDGNAPVSSSAVKAVGKAYTPDGLLDMVTPGALETGELPGIVADYVHAATCAKQAGFDGVEIHGANGYLLDQFLRDGCNRRTDEYGGSIENRARLPLQIVDAVTGVWGKDRTGIRLSPVSRANDLTDSNPQAIFGYLIGELSRRGLAFIHMIEGNTGRERDLTGFDFVAARRSFGGAYIANNGYSRDLAIAAVAEGRADAVAFGKPFIANPDLPERLRLDAPLAAPDPKTFYGGDARGYTDYPPLT